MSLTDELNAVVDAFSKAPKELVEPVRASIADVTATYNLSWLYLSSVQPFSSQT
jgi:hypothetical protein